jgi:hypothetical protein
MAKFVREMPQAIENPQGKAGLLTVGPTSVKELLLVKGIKDPRLSLNSP